MLLTALLSLAAGALTVLAPCVLPFLPVIVGGSLRGQRWRPYVVAASLVVSLLLFSLLLKASTALIGVDPRVWTTVSGVVVIALGLFMLFPSLWASISTKLNLDRGSHSFLDRAVNQKTGLVSAILTGMALGPVFSSCSPTYAWVLASILPVSPALGMVYLTLYCLGVAAMLLLIAIIGRSFIDRLRWASNPTGWFQRSIAVLFIIVGLLVATGVDKKFQAWSVQYVPSLSKLESSLIPEDNAPSQGGGAASDSGNAEGTGAGNAANGGSEGELNANYAAPELQGIQEWINSDPLTLEKLKGKVVLVDFWTYSCINCIRTQPYLNAWYDRYHDQGLEIIGVHAPEFAFEKVPANVHDAVQKAGISYPVALDNDYGTWNAYDNRYWPAKYLIDKDGHVRYTHFGEGEYDTTEQAIRDLLDAKGETTHVSVEGTATHGQSPETYLGTARAEGYEGTPQLSGGAHAFTPANELEPSSWTLGGRWKVDDESVTAEEDSATLTYRFNGREMYLVLGGPADGTVKVEIEGQERAWGEDAPNGTVKVNGDRLYRIVSLPAIARGTTVHLTMSKGVSAHAFTFGS